MCHPFCYGSNPVQPVLVPPHIFYVQFFRIGVRPYMAHIAGFIIFAKNLVGYKGYYFLRHYFFNENNTTAPLAFMHGTHIKAQVYFFKRTMEGYNNPFYPGIFKQEANKAHIMNAIKSIKFGTGWQVLVKYGGVNLIVCQNKVPPFCF